MILIWTLASVQFALSVEISDACNNPDQTVLDIVNVTVSDLTPEIWQTVEYYLYCDDRQLINPLINHTIDARGK